MNRSWLLFLGLASYLSLTQVSTAEVIFDDGLESGFGQFAPSGNSPSISSSPDPVRSGLNSMRVELTPNSATNYRTEATLRSANKWLDGETYSMGFNFYLDDWVYDSLPESIFQTHNLMDWSIPLTCISPESGAQPLFIMTKGDSMLFMTYPSIVALTRPIERNKWHSVVFQVKVSSGNDGMIRIWFNKSPLEAPDYEKLNAPTHKPFACPDEVNKYFGVYPKLGTYKWDWKKTVAEATRRLSYYDNIKVGNAAALPADVYTPADTLSTTTDITPPSVSISGPIEGSSVSGKVIINADATDNAGVSKVNFQVDGSYIATATSAPYSFAWDTTKVSNGIHSVRARAFDSAGNNSYSNSISVIVNNPILDTTAPVVNFLSPANGSKANGSVLVSTSASDDNGNSGIKQSLFIDEVWVASATGASLNYTLNTKKIRRSSFNIKITATDAAGNMTTKTITVFK